MREKRKRYGRVLLALLVCCILVSLGRTAPADGASKTGKVNADVLNLRKKPSYSGKIITTLKQGKKVTILSVKTKKGLKWYRVKVTVSGKTKKGYVLERYITPDSASQKGYTKKKVKVYKKTSTKSKKVATAKKGQTLTIKKTVKVKKVKWYQIKYKKNGKQIKGYVKASAVKKGKKPEKKPVADPAAEQKILQGISAFPKSYQGALTELHKKYPNWEFVGIDTGLSWADVVKNEAVKGRNTISSTAPKDGKSGKYSAPFSYLSTETGCYDWATDTYTLCDGTTWYTVHPDVLKYYLDPRNFLTEDTIFQFEDLAYSESQKKDIVQKILDGTFMSGNYSVTDKETKKEVSGNYADTFMEAGKINGISPYFLAARVRQEIGSTASRSVSGTVKGYKGIYNYYNIGANDSSSGKAVENGLLWASGGKTKSKTYMRPWTNPYKSLVGGAGFIAEDYVRQGQSTLYFQKFNVVNQASLYVHQYMTNVQAPSSEGPTVKKAYESYGILKQSVVFHIPVYRDMPEAACPLPAAKGNPNNYLKSFTVKDAKTSYKAAEGFQYRTTSYTVNLPASVSQVNVAATPISRYASVTSGAGSYTLKAGETKTVKLVCKAGNGASRTYKIKLVRAK